MEILNIFIRQDLKMRKGKMAAQSAHAVMKLLFDVMKKISERMILPSIQKDELVKFLQNPQVKITMVADEAALNQILDKSLPHAVIVDSGRTEFHGVPTVTCAAQGIFSSCDFSEIHVPHMYGKDIKAKQVFVFNKDIPLSKELACELSVMTCLEFLNQKMKTDGEQKYFDLTEDSAFVAWIVNAFAKIGLSAKTMDELNEVEDNLKANSITFIKKSIGANSCLCIEPCYPENIDPITGQLSLI
jgi:peptidyl-tRNA hydrolase